MWNIVKAAALAAMTLPMAANATSFVITYSGVVVSSTLAGSASTFTASFTYDDAVYSGEPGTGQPTLQSYTYRNIFTGATFASGSAVFSWMPGQSAQNLINVADSTGSNSDSYLFDASDGTSRARVTLIGPNSTLNSTALPVSIDLAKFTAQKTISFTNQGSEFRGTLTAISIAPAAVPEPAAWAMMLGGFGMIGGALRRSRRVAVGFG